MPEVNIVVKAKDEASNVFGGIGGGLKTLGGAFLGVGAVAGLALTGIGVGLGALVLDQAKMGPIEKAFKNLAVSIGTTGDALLKKLRPATLQMLSDDELVISAQKLLTSGLAETDTEVAAIAETATKLGLAVGKDAAGSIEQFANMLLTGGTRALKEFGISSSEVEERVKALQEANENLTDQQAFQQAVMEVGAETIARTGDLSDTAAVKMEALGARAENLKDVVAEALMPVLDTFLSTVLEPLVGKFEEWAPKLEPIMSAFALLAQKIVMPDQDWIGFLNTTVYEALENAFGEDAAQKITDFVEDSIEGLQDFVNDSLIPLVDNIRTEIIPAFMEWWESDGFAGVLITLRAIGDTIGDVIDKIGRFKDAINDLVNTPGFKWLVEQLTRGQQETFQQWYGGALEQLIPPILEQGKAQALQEAYSEQAYTPTGSWTINVYGTVGFEEAIARAERQAVGSRMQ
jgi:hypothetical protein